MLAVARFDLAVVARYELEAPWQGGFVLFLLLPHKRKYNILYLIGATLIAAGYCTEVRTGSVRSLLHYSEVGPASKAPASHLRQLSLCNTTPFSRSAYLAAEVGEW